MNEALLNDLQRRRAYPSITILMNTTKGVPMSPAEVAAARRMIDHVDQRLDGDVGGEVRVALRAELEVLLREQEGVVSSASIAWCASPDYTTVVRLGRIVDERVVIDETFATRDLVADLNRSAEFRVVTVSEQMTRVFVGDRSRLIEVQNEAWPMARGPEQSIMAWTRAAAERIRDENATHGFPTVVAGVDRTVRRSLVPEMLETIGFIPGNRDRSSWAELHEAAWPLVEEWLSSDQDAALQSLARARSARKFAGGLEELWALVGEGRIATLVVEDGFAVAVRVHDGRIDLTDDREAPDVVDDIVDEVIEAVLAARGRVVIVPDGVLAVHERIAAVLRF